MPKFDSTFQDKIRPRTANTEYGGREIVFDTVDAQKVSGSPPARGINIIVTTAFAGSGAALTAKLQGKATASANWTDIVTLGTKAVGALTYGAYVHQGAVPIPVEYKRARVAVRVGGNAFTAGEVAIEFPAEAPVMDTEDKAGSTAEGSEQVDTDKDGNNLIDR